MLIRRRMFPVMAAVRRLMPHFAVTFARGLALVHHQIAGDECGRGQGAAYIFDALIGKYRLQKGIALDHIPISMFRRVSPNRTRRQFLNVRFGSIATDPFRVSAEQCPLRSESDHHPFRDRLTLCTPPDLALTAESVSASPSGYPLIVVGHRVSCKQPLCRERCSLLNAIITRLPFRIRLTFGNAPQAAIASLPAPVRV
jgi:hypothetical protein